MTLLPVDSPCEFSRGRLGMGIGCILGLLAMFFDRLETLSFCSSAFYLELVSWDFRLLVYYDADPSLLLSSFTSDSFDFLFLSYYLRRISVFLAPSASSLISIHSWQKGNLLSLDLISLFLITSLLDSLQRFLISDSILSNQFAFLLPAFMSSLYSLSNFQCNLSSDASSESLYCDFYLDLLKPSINLFFSDWMLRLVQSLLASTEKASSLRLSLYETQSLMFLRLLSSRYLLISEQQFIRTLRFYDQICNTLSLRFCSTFTFWLFSNYLIDCSRNQRQLSFCCRSSSSGVLVTDWAMDWFREMEPRSTVWLQVLQPKSEGQSLIWLLVLFMEWFRLLLSPLLLMELLFWADFKTSVLFLMSSCDCLEGNWSLLLLYLLGFCLGGSFLSQMGPLIQGFLLMVTGVF